VTSPDGPLPPVARRLAGVRSSPVRDILALTADRDVVSFAGGMPAPELFDRGPLAEAFAMVLGGAAGERTLQYSTSEGDPRLRAALAGLLDARGLPTDPDDVLVTTGSQQGLTLAAAVLLDPGDVVLVEEPSYLAALQCFALAGARVVPVAGDEEGLTPEALTATAAEHGARLLYLVPTFQNPTGRTLGEDRRRRIAAAVAQAGLWLVEDDPYGELRYDGAPMPYIAGLPGAEERTVVLSSLSKIVSPGLRLGWARVPDPLAGAFAVAKQASDLHTSTVDQAAAAEYLAVADLDAHLVRLQAVYRERRDAMLDGLEAALPAGSTWTRPAGGMFVWVTLPDGHDAEALLPRALDHGVAFVPGASFFAGEPDRRTLRLSFTQSRPEEIAEGLRRLGAAFSAR
jgi:DNA-binding transcriptional MocR family regulator